MARALNIKNLCPVLPEVGKIKAGKKGEARTSKSGGSYQLPQKLSHFIVTGLERGTDGNFIRNDEIHKIIGLAPKQIKVRLLYDDPSLNFQSRYMCFNGKNLFCCGDGEKADRGGKEVDCTCERQAPDYKGQDRCKISGVLSVVLEDAQIVGGVWKFRTTSYNSVVNIMSSMALIQRITGGVLAGIPLLLTIQPKTVVTPGEGKTMTVYVVGLQYNGSMEQLAAAGAKFALEMAGYREQVKNIEEYARKQIAMVPNPVLDGEDPAEFAAEFYPEQEPEQPAEAAFDPFGNEAFDAAVAQKTGNPDSVSEFVKAMAAHFKTTEADVVESAVADFPKFWKGFLSWCKKHGKPVGTGPEVGPGRAAWLACEQMEPTICADILKSLPAQPADDVEWGALAETARAKIDEGNNG